MAQTDSDNTNESTANVFAGGGEMGARIRALDWTRTPLGAIGGWEQSLKTAVRIMLNSRYPMFVWWGENLINLYNDAYVPILGKRHPEALGVSARETWADIWNVVGPQSELVINEARSTWNEEVLLVMERNDFTEETYFTFSYSPIIDDAGRVGGVFCVCTEDTAKVVGRRRLQTLSALGERTAEAETAEQACRFAAQTLAENPADLPFAAVYLLDQTNERAALCEAVRIAKGSVPAPRSVETGSESDVWGFGRILLTGKSLLIDDLPGKYANLPAGTLHEKPQQAIVLPLARAGTGDALAGFLVAALSPNLIFDDEYRKFTELVAGHIATAISNARALDEERQRAAALAELDRAKTEFFSNVSHEFRTPLTLMLGNLEEVLRRDGEVPAAEREQIETAHRNSLRLLKLVNNLLDFSRLEAGKTHAHFEPTDLARYTAELASGFRSGIENSGIALNVDCPPLARKVSIDREMWEKIVLNLLSNAFKFTMRGAIDVALGETESSVELIVRDTGIGIAKEELPAIFERFHRVRSAPGRTHEGTGIGLSLVRELVDLHDGTIRVESEPRQGSTFTVSIPKRAADAPHDAPQAGENLSAAPAARPVIGPEWQRHVFAPEAAKDFEEGSFDGAARLEFYPSARILLADDNADMRGYISRLLVQNGYSVEHAGDGRAALEKLRAPGAAAPDLVITDVMMPLMDGFEFLAEIRKDARLREIPVIMLSARAGEEAKIEGFEAGADDYLIKPFSARELLARVNSVIELAKMRRAFEAEKEKSYAILQTIADAFYALDRDFRFTFLNDRAEQYFNVKREDVIGRKIWEVFPASAGSMFETEYERAFLENRPVEFEVLSPYSHNWVEVHASPTRELLLVYFRDINERKFAERQIAGQNEILEAVALGKPLEEILHMTTVELESQIPGALASVLLANETETQLFCGSAQSFPPAYNAAIDGMSIGDACGSCGTAASRRETVVVSDIANDPLWTDFGGLALSHNLRACWSHPIISPSGKLYGTFAAYFAAPRVPQAKELALLDAAARIAGIAIERARSAAALRKSETEFRRLADSVPQIVWVADGDGRVTYINEQWTEFTGFGLTETLDPGVAAIYHPDDRQQIYEVWQRALESGTPFEVEGRIRDHRTGDYHWFLMRSEPFRDGAGKIVKWFGTSTDITVNKSAENRAVLMAEISQLGRQFENPVDLLFAAAKAVGQHLEVRRCLFNEIELENDLEIVHRDYCRGVESVAGKHKISDYSAVTTAEMIAGKTIVNEDSKTDPRTAASYEKIYAQNGERAYVAVPLLRENRWVASLWVSDDKPRRWSKDEVSLLEFIAEQVWAVVEKLRIDAALRESEKRFRNMADHAPVMIWVTDATGYCQYLSQSWFDFTGQTPETGLGFGWLDATHPDDLGRTEEEFVAANKEHESFRLEYRLRRRDGEYAWAIDSAQPRFGENGEFLGYIGSVIDITERKLAEQERERLLAREQLLRAEAENANRLKDEFLATVSHELRTPLNSILGWASTVRQNNYNPEIMRRAFEVVERNARNQNQIISDILDVSRVITGKLNLNLQPVELSSAVLAAVDTVRPAIEAKGIRLATRLDPDAETIVGDADRLQQIVWNVLSNAVKFTPEGGSIEIALRYGKDAAEITVSDNGIGIEQDFLPYVFDRFRQADGRMNRRHGGLGLGLAIVRHLTELHGGTVFAESAGPGRGAGFTLRFPLKTRGADAARNGSEGVDDASKAAASAEESSRRRLTGMKILIVDDQPDALELTAFILAEQSAEVFTASSVDDALRIFAAEKLDALISDIGMPEKDGLELIREIKARQNVSAASGMPTIALTAYAREEDGRQVLEAGFDMYLPKPVEPSELIEAVIAVINKTD
ncbi:MAG TPA: ATP-binding protein [Pyrinomonadaceae bacterium]|jgi:PAS domain S-box-containing protein